MCVLVVCSSVGGGSVCACGSGVCACACVCVGGRVCVLVVVISVCGMLTYMSNYFRPIYISNVLQYTVCQLSITNYI